MAGLKLQAHVDRFQCRMISIPKECGGLSTEGGVNEKV
jgi:hypothetical protein